jgi:galactokinase
MTGASLAGALVDRGLDPAELQAKRSLFDLVLRRFAEICSSSVSLRNGSNDSTDAWWVPGRLEVFGTHTDYAGGRTLVCAVPRGFAVVARVRTDGVLRVVDARREQEVTLAPGDEIQNTASASPSGWRRYVSAVTGRLSKNFPGAALGADIVLASDLPRASGMSSSSALVVAVATVLARLSELTQREEWRRTIRGPEDEAGFYACMENGLSFGTLTGDSGVGTHGGSEDHAAILTATAGHLSAFSFVPMRPLGVVPLPGEWRFVLTPSGVTAQKAGAALEAYNRLADGTRVLLDLWNQHSGSRAESLSAALSAEGTAMASATRDRLRNVIRRSNIPGWSDDVLQRRLDHFIREDGRIADVMEAFRQADMARVGQLSEESQADAESLLGNQIPETIALPRQARALGAFASRSFGAGFGGSVWALVARDRAAEFARRWSSEAFVAKPGPPLVRLTQ